jgi:endonuclease III
MRRGAARPACRWMPCGTGCPPQAWAGWPVSWARRSRRCTSCRRPRSRTGGPPTGEGSWAGSAQAVSEQRALGLSRPPTNTHFEAVVRVIVYQQLAGAAASAIHGRLIAALGGEVTAGRLLSLPTETLRAAGVYANKAASLQDLANKVLDGTVMLDPTRLRTQSDDEVIARLSRVRGIGTWTAEMFLIFSCSTWTCGPLTTSGSGRGSGWPGASQRQPPSSSSRSATPTGPTVRSWPGTAGERTSSTAARRTAPSPAELDMTVLHVLSIALVVAPAATSRSRKWNTAPCRPSDAAANGCER